MYINFRGQLYKLTEKELIHYASRLKLQHKVFEA
jgi:hypothetical protein